MILRRSEQDIIKNVHWNSYKAHFNATCLFWTIFKKNSEIKFHENPSIGNRVVSFERTDRRTDKHDEANSRFFTLLRKHLKNTCQHIITN
jgi:hypothetical protein